jgi:excisionase family DNA binding protein
MLCLMDYMVVNPCKISRKFGIRKYEQYFDGMAEYLTISEFCEYFNLPRQTVSRWLRQKKLPGLRLGKSWRIPKSAIDKLESGEIVIALDEESGPGTDSDMD